MGNGERGVGYVCERIRLFRSEGGGEKGGAMGS